MIGDVDFDSTKGLSIFNVSHSINNEKWEAVAVLILTINADQIIKPLIDTGGTLGSSGDALLVNEDQLLITSLKQKLVDGSTAIPMIHRIEALPARLAALGEEGMIESIDYAGREVFAAYRHVLINPELGWD